MQRRLTLTIDEELYDALHRQLGRGNISRFIEDLVRRHLVTATELEAGYRAKAEDLDRERAAVEWADGLLGSAPS